MLNRETLNFHTSREWSQYNNRQEWSIIIEFQEALTPQWMKTDSEPQCTPTSWLPRLISYSPNQCDTVNRLLDDLLCLEMFELLRVFVVDDKNVVSSYQSSFGCPSSWSDLATMMSPAHIISKFSNTTLFIAKVAIATTCCTTLTQAGSWYWHRIG